jgi:RNA polymerase sigma-70 factor (ECF subfamily)
MGVRVSEREDVAQEVFLRIFRHLGGFDRKRPLAAWVYRMTANAALDWRTQKGRDRSVPIEEGHEDRAAPDGSEDSLLARRLEGALAALPDRERAVFVLKELEGLETGAVARALGITQITVRRHLGRARERVRALLTEKK